MTQPYLKPLALAAGLALSAGACGGQIKPNEAPAPTADATSRSVFDVGELDPRVDACQDFNAFVNQKWVAANPIPQDRTRWGAFDQLAENSLNTQHDIVETAAANAARAPSGSIEQKIGWLYRSGMDQAAVDRRGFAPLRPKLDEIAALEHPAQIADFLDKSFAQGDAYVFEFGPGADYQQAQTQIGYAQQGGLGLPTKDYYLDPKHADERAAYVAYIAKALQLTGVSAADAKAQADQVLNFETALAKASLAPVELRTPENQYHFVTLEQADKLTPHFKWENFFAAQGVTIERGFSLSQPTFFAGFDQLLASAPAAQWRAYLRFHAIDDASPYLSEAFQDNRFEFYGKTLAGQPQQKPRWKRVLSAVNGSMGQALGQLYVAQTFKPEAKRRAQELVDNVRNALKARIEQLDWMSAPTKAKAIAKWQTFLPKIGYPDTWRDWSGLRIVADDYYANIEAASQFNYRYELAKIGKPTDRQDWQMNPQTVNAYYNPTDNTINFPAAILQPPFFYANGDDAINYGGIGAVIGHEASHGFDDEGSQFDGAGNNVNWWSKQDRAQFQRRSDRLVKQFNDYTPLPDQPQLHVNGQLTLGENIADLGGLNVAYDALQAALKANPTEAHQKINGYTQDQRFFLNWARVWRGHVREKQAVLYLNVDAHAPAALRAIGAPSNMPAFAQAYQCKPGSPMVRSGDQQVKIW